MRKNGNKKCKERRRRKKAAEKSAVPDQNADLLQRANLLAKCEGLPDSVDQGSLMQYVQETCASFGSDYDLSQMEFRLDENGSVAALGTYFERDGSHAREGSHQMVFVTFDKDGKAMPQTEERHSVADIVANLEAAANSQRGVVAVPEPLREGDDSHIRVQVPRVHGTD